MHACKIEYGTVIAIGDRPADIRYMPAVSTGSLPAPFLLLGFVQPSLAMLSTWLLVPCLCSTFITAEVVCNPTLAPQWVPSLGSCNYAIRELEIFGAQCGSLPLIWTAIPGGAGAVRLPLMFTGQGPDYTPPTRIWCIVMVLWQPRPDSPVPPPTLSDLFPFTAVLHAARNIRDVCLSGWPWSRPTLGRQWIMPNEWVDVQLGFVIGPPFTNKNRHEIGGQRGRMIVHLADGSNRTAIVPALNASHSTCDTLLGLGAGRLRTIE